jgi:hypothetical protein
MNCPHGSIVSFCSNERTGVGGTGHDARLRCFFARNRSAAASSAAVSAPEVRAFIGWQVICSSGKAIPNINAVWSHRGTSRECRDLLRGTVRAAAAEGDDVTGNTDHFAIGET